MFKASPMDDATMPDPANQSLELARKHLERVQSSWDPPDWLDLASYGLYAIEAAVVAASLKLQMQLQRTHWAKSAAAEDLAKNHGLPQIADLMTQLNEVRKSEAYGDVASPPSLDAERVAEEIENYVEAVSDLVGDQ